MSGLSSQQIGKVGERLFYKLLILGSRGKLEAYIPVADEERRDFEVHIKGQYLPILALQVKCHTRLWPGKWRKFARLSISFRILEGNIRTAKLFWYVFASLDMNSMGFRDPVFIVPSAEVHKLARIPGRPHGKQVAYSFVASLDPHSRDKWSRYQVAASEVGERVLQILRELSSESMKAA